MENTVVIFMSDHGALLGEQGQFVKGPERLRKQVTHVPLLVRVPRSQYAGKKVPGFVQIPDIMPTILGRLDLKAPPRVTGHDLWPYVMGQGGQSRDHVVQAYGWIAAVRTPEWNYSAIWNKEKYEGSTRRSLMTGRKTPRSCTPSRTSILPWLGISKASWNNISRQDGESPTVASTKRPVSRFFFFFFTR